MAANDKVSCRGTSRGSSWSKMKNSTECAKIAKTLGPDCIQTTKTAVDLMQKCNLGGKGHHVYLDNYYCSPELFSELHYLETFTHGTARGGEKEFTKSSKKVKLKKRGDCMFRRGKRMSLC